MAPQDLRQLPHPVLVGVLAQRAGLTGGSDRAAFVLVREVVARLLDQIVHAVVRYDLAARLKQLGVAFTVEPGEALGGGRTVLFRDPEGNELQIVQRDRTTSN